MNAYVTGDRNDLNCHVTVCALNSLTLLATGVLLAGARPLYKYTSMCRKNEFHIIKSWRIIASPDQATDETCSELTGNSVPERGASTPARVHIMHPSFPTETAFLTLYFTPFRYYDSGSEPGLITSIKALGIHTKGLEADILLYDYALL